MSGLALTSGGLRLALAPESGGAVAGFWLHEKDACFALMRPLPEAANDALHAACFPMLPFANCLRDNSFRFGGQTYSVAPNMPPARLNFHGSGWRMPWRVAAQSADTALLRLDAEDGVWRYRAEQRFTLTATALSITLCVTNDAASPMPFSMGLHPWFPRHGASQVRFRAGGLWRLTPEGEAMGQACQPPELDFSGPRPVPRRGLNECYEGWEGEARIDWPAIGLSLVLSADPIFSRLMLYSPQTDPETFCLEPQTCPPCGFDGLETDPGALGAHILAPGDCLSGTITLRLVPYSPENTES